MDHVTGERLTALAATVATLLAAAGGVAAAVLLTHWELPPELLTAGAVVAGVAALVVGVVAWRAGARALLAVAVSVLAYALSSTVSGIAIAVLVVVAQGAVIAFGVLVLRGRVGALRALGWTAVVTGAGWFVTLLALTTVPFAGLPQWALETALTLPYLLQALAYLAAAPVVAGPLLRPVATGAARLWSSAEVR